MNVSSGFIYKTKNLPKIRIKNGFQTFSVSRRLNLKPFEVEL